MTSRTIFAPLMLNITCAIVGQPVKAMVQRKLELQQAILAIQWITAAVFWYWTNTMATVVNNNNYHCIHLAAKHILEKVLLQICRCWFIFCFVFFSPSSLGIDYKLLNVIVHFVIWYSLLICINFGVFLSFWFWSCFLIC